MQGTANERRQLIREKVEESEEDGRGGLKGKRIKKVDQFSQNGQEIEIKSMGEIRSELGWRRGNWVRQRNGTTRGKEKKNKGRRGHG